MMGGHARRAHEAVAHIRAQNAASGRGEDASVVRLPSGGRPVQGEGVTWPCDAVT